MIRETDRWNVSHFLLSHLNILQQVNRILPSAPSIQLQQFCSNQWCFALYWAEKKGFWKGSGGKKVKDFFRDKSPKKPTSLEDCSKGLSSFCCFSCRLIECEEIILEWIKDDKIKQICRYLVTSECGTQKLCKLWHYQDN